MILGTVKAVKTRASTRRQSTQVENKRKRKVEVKDQQTECSSTKRKRGAPQKVQPEVVQRFLNSKTIFSTHQDISMLFNKFYFDAF